MEALEKRLLVVCTLAIAATRLIALSLTPHDWDELLFAAGVREYDVVPHHPHPPGYPLFVAFAKLARFFASSDFHALQIVATLASMLIFPAAFLLARELRFRTPFAFAAAALTAFIPTIWYYGGTAMSDVPALALVLFASAMLLRGGRSPRAYVAGALLAAAACCIRPHLIMIVAVPAVIGAFTLRRWRTIAAAWIAAAAVIVLTYAAAAWFSSDFPNGYLTQLRHIQKHIATVDGFGNPLRTPLLDLVPRVFLFPFGGGRMRYVVPVLMAIALLHAVVKKRASVGVLALMFLPIAVFTWLMLDMTASTRYAIAYVPLHAFLVVAGIEVLTLRKTIPLLLLTGFLTFSLIKWTLPALRFARTEPSPVVAAFEWIRNNVPRGGPRVFVQNPLVYHARYFIPDYDYVLVNDKTVLHEADYAPGNILVFEGETQHADPHMFRRKRLQLWEIARARFFEVGIVPTRRIVRYGPGWHLLERDENHTWRWMARESRTILSPALYGRGELRLKLYAPVDAVGRPNLTVIWNDVVIDRRPAPPNGDFDLRYTLDSRRDRPNELRLQTDQTFTPPDDGRELGLSLQSLTWQ